jgi:protease IV
MSIKRRFLGLLIQLFKGLIFLTQGLVSLIIVLIIVSLIGISFDNETEFLPESAALKISPNGILVDQKTFISPIKKFLDESDTAAETSIFELIDAIDYAATDPRITSLVLQLDYLTSGSISKLEEVGEALVRFKSSGKPIVAIGDSYSQEQYYLASYADEIHLHPMGSVILEGYGRYTIYLKEALDKLRIKVNVFRVGTYKDAIEPFTRSSMSEASRKHTSQWIHEIWNTYTTRVEGLRGLSKGSINGYANNLGKKLLKHQGNAAKLALDTGLIDKLSSRQEVMARLILLSGLADNGGYQHIDSSDYLKYIKQQSKPSGSKISMNQVALIVAKGVISEGDQPDGLIGSESLSKLLRQAREDDKIKAAVIRIDSPGGSAFASEVIRQEMVSLKNSGKPVVVSMGSVAASGGYWIAMGASEVWASPTTITGSIGVFGIIPTFEDTLQDLGVQSDGLGTTALSDIFQLSRPMSNNAKKIIQAGVDHTYSQFLAIVAEARSSSIEEVDLIAQGRVWTGKKALDLGLVDQLGSLAQSLDSAAKSANLDGYEILKLTRPLDFREKILQEIDGVNLGFLAGAFPEKWNPLSLTAKLKGFAKKLILMTELNDPRGIYLSCFECAE